MHGGQADLPSLDLSMTFQTASGMHQSSPGSLHEYLAPEFEAIHLSNAVFVVQCCLATLASLGQYSLFSLQKTDARLYACRILIAPHMMLYDISARPDKYGKLGIPHFFAAVFPAQMCCHVQRRRNVRQCLCIDN